MRPVPLYNAEYWVESHGSGCLRFFRALLMGMNVLLTAGAVAGLAIGLLERNTMENTLNALCQSCHQIFVAYISVFSVLLAFSLLGFFALCTRNTLLRVVYFIYLFVVFLGAFSISIAYVLISTNQVSLEAGWNRATVNSAPELCLLELRFHCSGWEELCNTSSAGPLPSLAQGRESPLTVQTAEGMYMSAMLPSAVHTNPNLNVSCPACDEKEQEEINGYNNTCKSVLVGTVRDHMNEVLPIGLSITGVALLGMIVTCLLQHETNCDAYYGGRYYRV